MVVVAWKRGEAGAGDVIWRQCGQENAGQGDSGGIGGERVDDGAGRAQRRVQGLKEG